VYNGERYLAQAIESILAQTFVDFELIICDNASTDRTESICRSFADRDPRVRYYRNPTNLGAAPNYNKCFEYARGEYVRWAAHDDFLGREYLERCVAALDANPDAVLCQSRTVVVDEEGVEVALTDGTGGPVWEGRPLLDRLDVYDPPHDVSSRSVNRRIRELLINTGWCFEIFGVMRRSALLKTPLHLSFYGSDKVLLVAMAIEGPWVTVDEPLFFRRYHPGQSSSKSNEELKKWIDARNGHSKVPAQVRCLQWYLRLINRSNLGLMDRVRGYFAVFQWGIWLCRLVIRDRNRRGIVYRTKRALRASLRPPVPLPRARHLNV
jgi:glycosyltransferase involved in cell wall biosynthesis